MNAMALCSRVREPDYIMAEASMPLPLYNRQLASYPNVLFFKEDVDLRIAHPPSFPVTVGLLLNNYFLLQLFEPEALRAEGLKFRL